MKIILQQDVKGLGKKGSLAEAKDGFVRNYLLPKGLALKATPDNLSAVERKIKSEVQRIDAEKKKAQEFADKLAAVSCAVSVDTHDDDKLYGSVTSAHIASALEADGIILDKKQIILEEPLKALGIYDVEVRLYPDVKAKVKVWVVKK